jgi:hypothetical protein
VESGIEKRKQKKIEVKNAKIHHHPHPRYGPAEQPTAQQRSSGQIYLLCWEKAERSSLVGDYRQYRKKER